MPSETREKISKLLMKVAVLTAACEGNMYHDPSITNKSIFEAAVEIQSELLELSGE